jgi:DUF1365 family protein
MPVEPGTRGPVSHEMEKVLHVSPLIGMSARYRIRLTPPGERLGVLIRESDEQGEFLVATLTGERRPFTDRAMLRLFFTMPLLTLKVIAGIHWQAVKLMIRGVPFHRRPAPPSTEVTLPVRGRNAA